METPIDIQKQFFHPVCNPREIERVFDVKDASDYLLKLRAETIVDHMRLFRVYRNKALRDEKNWSLEKSFDTSHYERFLDRLSDDDRRQCLKTTFGDMFSNDPNGSVFATDYGPIITISSSLQFFLKFAHLALMPFNTDIPEHVELNGLRIAMRVMLKSEALDFFMDPRGSLPRDVGEGIHAPLSLQMQFIAGHEFAHHVLGHLNDSTTSLKPIYFAISSNEDDYKPIKTYNRSQQEEFDADVQAILLPDYTDEEIGELLHAALLWFGALELFEAVSDEIFPVSTGSYKSHPTARDRFDNLLTKIPTPSGFSTGDAKRFGETVDFYKQLLLDDVSANLDLYEFYGSVYLDAPNTEWRGPELVDRIDYY